jgi:hypothetical protein
MPIFQGDALLATRGLSEATGAFVPASASIDASCIAEVLAEKAFQNAFKKPRRSISKRLTPERISKISRPPQEIIQRGVDIKLQELCWMSPPGSSEDFAHICIMLSKSQGSKYTECVCLSVILLISGEGHGRSKVLICDSDHGDTLWISRKQTAMLHPFKASSNDQTNFTEKFLKRDGHLNTRAFQEALKLAEMHLDESNPHRAVALKLLHLGSVQRQQLVTRHQLFQQHQHFCEEMSTEKREKFRGTRAPFFLFQAERLDEMKATNSRISVEENAAEVSSEISKEWRALSFARKTECPPIFPIPIHWLDMSDYCLDPPLPTFFCRKFFFAYANIV